MSKFNYNSEIYDQLDRLDEKLVEVITVMKSLEKRLKKLESIAKEKGLMKNSAVKKEADESCMLM